MDEGISANEQDCTRAASLWPHGDRIEVGIFGAPEYPGLRIPIDFIRNSGDNTWSLVHRGVSLLFNEK